jgi:hypothetical protein
MKMLFGFFKNDRICEKKRFSLGVFSFKTQPAIHFEKASNVSIFTLTKLLFVWLSYEC